MGNREAEGKLGDFTATPRMLVLSLFGIVIGVISAFVALILLKLIGIVTNLLFFQRWGTDLVSPAHNTLGWLEIFVPIIGGLIVGLMARYGSERIRGHGIPEALESILINGSKIEPKVSILKPVASAIAIGSGGPFGAEGPIIMTGGAFGSLVAQFFHMTSNERKILLVAGAAGGMSAIFASPIAGVLLAVELLLFEWKPRSLIPVVLASVTAFAGRIYLLGSGPLFPTPPHPAFIGVGGLLCCVLVGLIGGIFALLLTRAVYAFEDGFHRLPIHWMWWPILGGIIVGIGGLIVPQALGVGYDVIGSILKGQGAIGFIVALLIVKAIIWSGSLGSGTSGGVVAPLLMIGAALGTVEALFLPHEGAGFWALISMGAVLGSTMGIPLTSVIFVLELTHDINALVPLLIAVAVSYAFTVLVMPRSILTEKVARRGYHLSREYTTDPLEIIFIREIMRTNIVVLPAHITRAALAKIIGGRGGQRGNIQHLYPVIDENEHMVGVATRRDLETILEQTAQEEQDWRLADLVKSSPIVSYPDETLRIAVYRMAETGFTRLPVVDRADPQKLVGLVSLNDLLKARMRHLEEDRRRERVLRLRLIFPRAGRELPLPEENTPEPQDDDAEEDLVSQPSSSQQ